MIGVIRSVGSSVVIMLFVGIGIGSGVSLGFVVIALY